MKILSACLALLLGCAGWAWLHEHDAAVLARRELAVARARLSAFDGVGELAGARPAGTTPCPPTPIGDNPSEQLAAVAKERDQYKTGFEGAVAELKSLRGRREAEAESAAATEAVVGSSGSRVVSRPSLQQDGGRVISLRGPDLQIQGDRVLVTGALWSGRETPSRIEATINFLRNNERIDSKRLSLVVIPKAETRYEHYFQFNSSLQGNYTASIEIP